MLATGSLLVTVNPRVHVETHRNGNSLVIENLLESDSGEYVCQVIQIWSDNEKEQKDI